MVLYGPYRPDNKTSVFSRFPCIEEWSFNGQAEHKGIKEPYSNAIIRSKFSHLLTVRMGGGASPLMVSLTVKILLFSDHSSIRDYEKKLPFFDHIALIKAT